MRMHLQIFKEYFRTKYLYVMVLCVVIIIGTVVSGIVPFMYGKIIDSITASDFEEVVNYLGINFLLMSFTIVVSYIEDYLGNYIILSITNEVKANLFQHIVYLKSGIIDKYSSGELINRVEGDVGGIVSTYLEFITSIIQVLFNLAISLYFIFGISKKLSSFAIAFIPIMYLINMIFKKKTKKVLTKQKVYNDKYFGYINERLSNIFGIKAFQLEDISYQKLTKLYKENEKISKEAWIINGELGSLKGLADSAFSFGILFIASKLIVLGKLTIGNLVSFNEYISRLFDSVSKIMSLNMSFNNISVSIERINEIKLSDSENHQNKLMNEEETYIHKISQIEFRKVTFSYDSKKIIDKASFEISSNGFYAFVGINGSGKSTIFKLLVNFYKCNEGTVLLNGIEISKIPLCDLRHHITYISKEIFIINDTIINNITLDYLKQDLDLIKKICDRVGIDNFIEELPDKYQTIIGENGLKLSSGLKQRLAIARAIYRNSSVILLDEGTSDLDGKIEQEVVSLLREEAVTRIIILISHKNSSIKYCDKIFLLNNGKIKTSGTHYELINSDNLYKEMFQD